MSNGVFKCSLVKKVGGKYNNPSLKNNNSNKKMTRTVTYGNRSEIHRFRKYHLLNWNMRILSGRTPCRYEKVTALRPTGDFIGLIQRPCLTTQSTSLHSLFSAECTKLINLPHNSSYIGMESAIRYIKSLDICQRVIPTPSACLSPSHTNLIIIQVPQLRAVNIGAICWKRSALNKQINFVKHA